MRSARAPLALFCVLLLLPAAAFGTYADDAVLAEMQFQALWEEAGPVEDIQAYRFGVVDWKGETVTTRGHAPLHASSSQGQMMAKRAALTDARRNLLYLLYEIRHGLPERFSSIEVEGEVVDGQVDFQGVRDGVYTVEVTVPLKRFFAESKIVRAEVR